MKNKQELENLYSHYEEEMLFDIETEKTARLRRKIIEETDELYIKLTEEQKNKLEHLLEVCNERDAEEMKEVFIWAFELAIRIFTAGLNVEGGNNAI